VHVFVLNADGTELNSAQISDLQSRLALKAHLGTTVYVSNVQVVEVDVGVIANIEAGQNPKAIADLIFKKISGYLSPGFLPLGQTILIKELEYEVRQVVGVSSVVSVTQGRALGTKLATDLQLPKLYSAARLYGLAVQLLQGGQVYDYYYGDGDPD